MDVRKIAINMPTDRRPDNSTAFWHNKIVRDWLCGGSRIPANRVYTVLPEGRIELIRIDGKPLFLYGLGKMRRDVMVAFSGDNGERMVSVYEQNSRLTREFIISKGEDGRWKADPITLSERQALNLYGDSIRCWLEENGEPPAGKRALVYKSNGEVKLCNVDKNPVVLRGLDRLKGQSVTLRFKTENRRKVISLYQEDGRFFKEFTLKKSGDSWKAVPETPNATELMNNDLIRAAVVGNLVPQIDIKNMVFQQIAYMPLHFEVDGRKKAFNLRGVLIARGLPANSLGMEILMGRLGLLSELY